MVWIVLRVVGQPFVRPPKQSVRNFGIFGTETVRVSWGVWRVMVRVWSSVLQRLMFRVVCRSIVGFEFPPPITEGQLCELCFSQMPAAERVCVLCVCSVRCVC